MSGKYFIAQQRDLGKVNGYIEEMMEGQKGRQSVHPRAENAGRFPRS